MDHQSLTGDVSEPVSSGPNMHAVFRWLLTSVGLGIVVVIAIVVTINIAF